MAKYELNETQIKNNLTILNKCLKAGLIDLNEVDAIIELKQVFSNPIKEEIKKEG